jgi:hypothetical protein
METGSPTSSAVSFPWPMLLIAGLVVFFAGRFISHQERPIEAKEASNSATRPDGAQDHATTQDENRGRLPRNSRKLSDEEVMAFLRDTILEEVTIADKSLEEVVILLRKDLRKAVTDGPVAGLGVLESCSFQKIPELKLRKVPLGVTLKYVCAMTKCRYRIENGSVLIVPLVDNGETLDPIQKELETDLRGK